MALTRLQAPNRIRCTGRSALAATWIFGGVLTAMAWGFWSVLLDQPPQWTQELGIESHDLSVILTVLATLITLIALTSIGMATRNWRTLGPVDLLLDPYPPGIGGELGGILLLNVRPNQLEERQIAVQCVRRRRNSASSSRNTSWHETVLWEAEGTPHVDSAGRQSRLVMRFHLPPDQPASFSETTEQVVWRVYLEVMVDGRGLRRTFTVPITDTPVQSTSLQRYSLTSDHPSTEDLPRAWVREIPTQGRLQFHFPAFRHLKALATLAIIGLLAFGGPALLLLWMRWSGDGPPLVFPVLLLLVAFLLVLPLFWLPFSLRVTADRSGVRLQRFWFGLPIVDRFVDRVNIQRFEASSNKQIRFGDQRQIVFHQVFLHTHDHRVFRCSHDLPGPIMAQQYEQRLRHALNL